MLGICDWIFLNTSRWPWCLLISFGVLWLQVRSRRKFSLVRGLTWWTRHIWQHSSIQTNKVFLLCKPTQIVLNFNADAFLTLQLGHYDVLLKECNLIFQPFFEIVIWHFQLWQRHLIFILKFKILNFRSNHHLFDLIDISQGLSLIFLLKLYTLASLSQLWGGPLQEWTLLNVVFSVFNFTVFNYVAQFSDFNFFSFYLLCGRFFWDRPLRKINWKVYSRFVKLWWTWFNICWNWVSLRY